MWVITVFLKENIKGNKILSEIVYFNDPCFV